MDFIFTVLVFVAVIGIIIIVHELGHFIGARISGMRVDVFSVGMGTRLFGYNKNTGFSFGNLAEDWESEGNTDYRLSLFPIGGYVKIVGMIDESLDTDFVKSDPQPWEFRSKNAFQKIIALSGGVLMNAALSVCIIAVIAYLNGEVIKETTTVGFVPENSLSQTLGLKYGDEVISVNGQEIKTWNECEIALSVQDLGKDKEVEINRSGERIILKTSGDSIVQTLDREQNAKIYHAHNSVIAFTVQPNNPAEKAGMLDGDIIEIINDEIIYSEHQLIKIIQAHKEIPIEVKWKHGDKSITSMMTPTEDGIIGIQLGEQYTGQVSYSDYSVFESIGIGFSTSYKYINLFLSTISQMFKGNLSFTKSIGGPIAIAVQASNQAERGMEGFFGFVAMLSITLAVINILPFPALDGGHLVFVSLEGILRREVSLKVKIAFQQVGIVILLLLMSVIIINDIIRYFF